MTPANHVQCLLCVIIFLFYVQSPYWDDMSILKWRKESPVYPENILNPNQADQSTQLDQPTQPDQPTKPDQL